MKIKELIEQVTEALHGTIRGGRLPRSIVCDSIMDRSQALLRAKGAHSECERGLGAKDYNRPLWYAAYIAMEQGLAEKSASKLASSAIEVSPGSENAPPLKVVSFLHLRPGAQAGELAAIFKSGGADVAISWHQGGRELGKDDVQAARKWLARDGSRQGLA